METERYYDNHYNSYFWGKSSEIFITALTSYFVIIDPIGVSLIFSDVV